MKLILTNQYAEILLLVNGLAVLFYYAAKKKKKQRAMKFGNYETLQKVAGKNFLKTTRIILFIKMLAMTSLLIGLSNPVIEEEVNAADSDYVITIDKSTSMLSSDIEPSRLEVAKKTSTEFINSASNTTEIGLVSFSGSVNEISGLETNKPKLRKGISNISTGGSAGTAIGDALYTSVSILMDSSRSKKVILITDGRNNVGGSVEEAVNFAQEENVTINTIGIGEDRNGTEEVREFDDFEASSAQFQNINTTELNSIASETGGNFTTATNETELSNALLKTETRKERNDISEYFFLFALILLLAEWGLGTTKYDVLP